MLGRIVGRLAREDGQIVALLAVGLLVVIVAIAGVAVDVGHAYQVKRKLQATADAAALAAAGALPTTTTATQVATQYGATGKNPVAGATEQVTPFCLRSVSFCYGNQAGTAPTNGQANGIVVSESDDVSTTFLSLIGINTLHVSAKATACGLCGTQPLNIALVIDRTGSMAPNINDLRSGLQTFGLSLDPNLDYISLLVLPPSSTSNACSPAPDSSALPLHSGDSYPTSSDNGYVTVHYSHDYLNGDGSLNYNSALVKQVACVYAAGSTSYVQALRAAQQELANPPAGRADAQKVIVFESDGAANTAPDSYFDPSSGQQVPITTTDQSRRTYTYTQLLYSPASGHSADTLQPCGSAVNYANTLKASGTIILSVAYQANDDCYQAPEITGSTTSTSKTTTHYTTTVNRQRKTVTQTITNTSTTYSGVDYEQHLEGLSASSALAQIASTGDAYSASNAATMNSAFAGIANKVQGAQLVADSDGP